MARAHKPGKAKRTAVQVAQAHEAFCQAIANGMTQTNAYLQHVSSDTPNANKSGSALAARYADRIAAIIAENNAIAAAARVLTKQEAMEFLTNVVRTPIGEIDHTSPLCQERTYTVGREEDSVKVKMPGKREAIGDLAKMLGWNMTEKVDVTVSTHEDIEKAIDKMFAKRAK
mgnify:CR=1 FL=1